jgi:hypothetical protein
LPAMLLGLLSPAEKVGQGSAASTRASSPSSSAGSSEDPVAQAKQPVNGGIDSGVLARRRGRSVLMLSELVLDSDVEGMPGGSPSDESLSSLARGSRCVPCTPQMMSYSPPTSTGGSNLSFSPPSSTAASSGAGACMAQRSMAPEIPLLPGRHVVAPGGDASQRSPAPTAGPSAAGGDASHRISVGRISLGVATIKGDASQRSPPGCASRMAGCSFAQLCTVPTPMQQNSFASAVTFQNSSIGNTQRIMGTSPDASNQDSVSSFSRRDASERGPSGSVLETLTVNGCNDVVRSWLTGASSNGIPVNDTAIAEQLLAAVPESYED